MTILLVLFAGVFIIWQIHRFYSRDHWKKATDPFPDQWRNILRQKVDFYNLLATDDQARFELQIQEFILNYPITGVEVQVESTDSLLIAASAIIPIFNFPEWRYPNLSEILLYPGSFNEDFATSGPERRILGMVGNGYMEGKVILSKAALHLGFDNRSDKKNTAIHEFVHLIDKADGNIDGVPQVLLERPYIMPWLDLMNKKIDEIYEQGSDINPYGGTNKAEFFAVASEYFFERPKLLKKKHPELYQMLKKIFTEKR